MRRFVFIGQTARADGAFSLDDFASSSGRLDVLLQCVRAALLVSNGVRRDTQVYLVLRGGEKAPKTLRFDGETVKFLRPDERSLAILVQKTLVACDALELGRDFQEMRPGIFAASGDLDVVLSEPSGAATTYVLHEDGTDVRDEALTGDLTFFVGDQHGFDSPTLERLEALGCRRLSLGPTSLHSEDAVAVVMNEVDRRGAG